MSMDPLAADHGRQDCNIKLPSPSASPKLITPSSDIGESDFGKWKTEDRSTEAKPEQSETSLSAIPTLFQQSLDGPLTPDDSTMKCESVSASDSYSIISSPRNLGWLSSSESGESEPWPLRQDMLPDQSLYSQSPSTPGGAWDCSVPYQFQAAPTSAGYYQDCSSIPFSASTPSQMQTPCSPAFELASAHGSPQYPTGHFDDASHMYHTPASMGIPSKGGIESDMGRHVDYSILQRAQSSNHCPIYPTNGDSEIPDIKCLTQDQINTMPYSKLLYLAFMSSDTRRMQLKDIYKWFESHTNKTGSNGWQNSIRHNLSMNKAFVKADQKEDGTESRRSTEWVLHEKAIRDGGVESTTRFRKGKAESKSSLQKRVGPSRVQFQGGGRAASLRCRRIREQRLHSERQPHGLSSDSHMGYENVAHPAMAVNDFQGFVPYISPPGTGDFSPDSSQRIYSGFAQEVIPGPEAYPVYTGEDAMGEYMISNGLHDGNMAGIPGGGTMSAPSTMVMPYGARFPPGMIEATSDGQHHPYTPADYSVREGVAANVDGVREWSGN